MSLNLGESKSSDLSLRICDSPVLVTGGTGFVAGHLIQQLLQRGYRVRATIREEVYAKSENYFYLTRLQMASELLEIVPLNLNTDSNDTTWKAAFAGVEYVMHVASPVVFHSDNPQQFIINPIIMGTQSVLRLCQDTPSVKKLILTSCMSAITDIFEDGVKYDENSWNEQATPTESIYSYSKTTAEREAQRAVMSNHSTFQLVSILPGTILGAHLGKKMSHSHYFFRNFLGKGIPNIGLAVTDVRDVARCHIAAMERQTEEKIERFICANTAIALDKILQIVHENFDDLVVPTRKVSDMLVKMALRRQPVEQKNNILNRLSKPPVFSRSRMKLLGVPLRTPAESVVDTCRFLIENNFIAYVDESDTGLCLIL